MTEGPPHDAEGLRQLVLRGLRTDVQPLRHFSGGESFQPAQLKHRAASFREFLSQDPPQLLLEKCVCRGIHRIRPFGGEWRRDIGCGPLARFGMPVHIAREVPADAVRERLKAQSGCEGLAVLPDAEERLLHDIMRCFNVPCLKGDTAQEGRLIPREECLECLEIAYFHCRYEVLFVLRSCHSPS